MKSNSKIERPEAITAPHINCEKSKDKNEFAKNLMSMIDWGALQSV